MIGNGRRGAGERNRDLEEDDELESREERGSESGGGGGGFGGWRSHLLGGLTQRVKSWYWGARPLVSFPTQRKRKTLSLLDKIARFLLPLLSSSSFPTSLLPLALFSLFLFLRRRRPTLRVDSRKGERGKGVRGRGGK